MLNLSSRNSCFSLENSLVTELNSGRVASISRLSRVSAENVDFVAGKNSDSPLPANALASSRNIEFIGGYVMARFMGELDLVFLIGWDNVAIYNFITKKFIVK